MEIKSQEALERDHAERVLKQVDHWWPRWGEYMVDRVNSGGVGRPPFILMPLSTYFLNQLFRQDDWEELAKADRDVGFPCDEAEAILAERAAKMIRESGWKHARVSFRERTFGGWERTIELTAALNRRERSRQFWFLVAGVVCGVVVAMLVR